ncbi:MAG: RNB domain-containing ribonuclease [Mycobacteriaceae bacterium]
MRITAQDIDFTAIKTEFGIDAGFSDEALAEVRSAVDRYARYRQDFTDLALVTIDPPGAMDLDQALHIEKTATGFLLHYAIADVAAVVIPSGKLEKETFNRAQTYYFPDGSVPLHPTELSEGSASLLPDLIRPAALWRIELDNDAQPTSWNVQRALVKSVARLDYAQVQRDVDSGDVHPSIIALAEFGRKRKAAALARGAIELALPTQEVVRDAGNWQLIIEPRTEVDSWNAEVSLLTGMCAAQIMMDGAVGLLRVLPKAETDTLLTLRLAAHALGLNWPEDRPVGEFLAGLHVGAPSTLAMMMKATSLLRGAEYVVIGEGVSASEESFIHAGIGAPYAHVTAPLRRLADRFATETCLALCASQPVPRWVTDGFSSLVETMRSSDTVANKIERACVDLAEAVLLKDRVGEEFSCNVVRGSDGKRSAEIFISEPAILAKCSGNPPEGEVVKVILVTSDPSQRLVSFKYSASV